MVAAGYPGVSASTGNHKDITVHLTTSEHRNDSDRHVDHEGRVTTTLSNKT